MNKIDTRFIGKAGEYRVMAELLIRGIHGFMGTVDNSVDIILESGIKIQVKSSSLRSDGIKGYTGRRYMFEMRRSYYTNGKKEEDRKYAHRSYKKDIDFIICWGIDDDIFYVLPIDIVPESTISIYPHRDDKIKSGRPSEYEKYLNAWNLLTQGRENET